MTDFQFSAIKISPYVDIFDASWTWSDGVVTTGFTCCKRADISQDETDHYNFMIQLLFIHPLVHDWYVETYNVKGWDIGVYKNESLRWHPYGIEDEGGFDDHGLYYDIKNLCTSEDIDSFLTICENPRTDGYHFKLGEDLLAVKYGETYAFDDYCDSWDLSKGEFVKKLEEFKEVIKVVNILGDINSEEFRGNFYEYLNSLFCSKAKSARK